MAPNTTVARPTWVWSLPAVAVFISFLWFRKKRGLLKTDTGGPGQRQEHLTISDTSAEVVDTVKQVEEVKTEVLSAVDSAIEDISSAVVNEEEEEIVVLPQTEVEEEVKQEEQVVIEEVKQEEEEVVVTEVKQEVIEEVVISEKVPIVAATTATPSAVKVGGQQEPELGGKWSSKKCRKGKKNSNNNNMISEERKSVPLDQQLAKLELGTGDAVVTADGEVGDRHHSEAVNGDAVAADGERDSANTSPSEVMLASPSLSAYSDTHSEGSSDSGKGCSEVLTPSPTPVSGNSLSGDLPCELPCSSCKYEFVIPQHLVGRLIGRNGSYIQEMKEHTHASVYIKRHPDTPKLKICSIEGTQLDIDNALDMIRIKFPKKRYPNMTLEQIELPPEPSLVLPDNMQLYLVEGINNDVILSSLVSAAHFFLQQPTHPTYPALNRLNSCMTLCYAEPNLPALPEDIHSGVLCVAPVNSGWYRAEVTCYPEGELCQVKFVDYGGYMMIEKASLRQIRGDFATLPFQASECYLAAVQPLGEDWSKEARELVESLTFGRVLQAQVHGYTDTGIPLIYLYTVQDGEVVSINDELVSHGFAEWLLPEPVTEDPQQQQYEYVQPQAPQTVIV